MSDLWDSAKLPSGLGYRGDVVRERPIIDDYPLGPWRARVRLTPLVGLEDRARFEVSAQWEAGPPLLAFEEHWDGSPHAATDVAHFQELEHARAVALQAADLLRNGVRFDLQQLARDRARHARFGSALGHHPARGADR
jgi:hypothetical protein